MQVFTILGSNPELSIAELEAVTDGSPSETTNEVAIFNDVDVELTKLQSRLGGIQKLGMIVGSIATPNAEELSNFLATILESIAQDKKIRFGISIYNISDSSRTKKLQSLQQAIGLETKKKLKYAGHSARYVTSKEKTLSSVAVTKNQLLEDGAEFVLLVKKREILIGQTVAVQNFEDWSHRDYDRPARDARRGMLPPKLARIMVNLAALDLQDATLLDPFCGSGTILMEAAMVGAQNLIGSDISEEAVEDTRANLEWLKTEGYNIPMFEILESKASNLAAYHAKESIDLVVTEPFLGRPRTGKESKNEIQKMVDDLGRLYKESFSIIKPLMKPGAVLVVASPIHFVQNERFGVRTSKILKEIDFTEKPISSKPVIYMRQGQYLGREILRFTH